METERLRNLLEKVRRGETTVDEALAALREFPTADLGYARLDTHRSLRSGFPEVIFCEGKEPDQVLAIFGRLLAAGGPVLATRVAPDLADRLTRQYPEAVHHPRARIVAVQRGGQRTTGKILVVTAGTADLPVAEEAAITAETMGHPVERLYDVGVAGLHRLLERQKLLYEARVLVVVAGMDGALASVVAGLVDKPVVAVPTSVGYGASFHGLAALLSMLNSCAAGVAVVNIDNGFGAGWLAGKINQLAEAASGRGTGDA
ncbi:MAG: nickel pincer cofactor biosynthesis protein LarB [Bacillota bacterium]|nr:nickel pincer cofactor biosynthesis protein LarB [Bacillota bacterium]